MSSDGREHEWKERKRRTARELVQQFERMDKQERGGVEGDGKGSGGVESGGV